MTWPDMTCLEICVVGWAGGGRGWGGAHALAGPTLGFSLSSSCQPEALRALSHIVFTCSGQYIARHSPFGGDEHLYNFPTWSSFWSFGSGPLVEVDETFNFNISQRTRVTTKSRKTSSHRSDFTADQIMALILQVFKKNPNLLGSVGYYIKQL